MSKHLQYNFFYEHSEEEISFEEYFPEAILFKGNEGNKCVEVIEKDEKKYVCCHYYVGLDWLVREKVVISVAPKLDLPSQHINYLEMLYSCLRLGMEDEISSLYEIKWTEPSIEISQKQDVLMPFLVMQFLYQLKKIVKLGLKKSHYSIDKTLFYKIKGKIKVPQTIKQNITKNVQHNTHCQYQEFGLDCTENRILKKALLFVQKYLNLFPEYAQYLAPIVRFCFSAFQNVSENIDENHIKNFHHNPFYRDYKDGLLLAHQILKRLGYNIKNIDGRVTINTPPFWIDMPKLFELYVFSKLKENYHHHITFQTKGGYGNTDFLLISEDNRCIIDTKYKKKYRNAGYDIQDIRQLSGYARDIRILSQLGYKKAEERSVLVDCIIIYPDQSASESLSQNLKEKPISEFVGFYKIPIKLPVID